MTALSRKWFPMFEPDAQTMGEAIWLENDHWEKMSIAVANGIAKSIKGR